MAASCVSFTDRVNAGIPDGRRRGRGPATPDRPEAEFPPLFRTYETSKVYELVIQVSRHCHYLPRAVFFPGKPGKGGIPGGSGRMTYIVKLAPAAQRIFRSLEPYDQRGLDRVLAEELVDGPNADKEIRFDSDGGSQPYADPDADGTGCYTATPLSFKAYTAIHRPMTEDELSGVSQGEGGPAAERGFYVFEILAAESAFTRRPGGLAAVPRKPTQRDLPPGTVPGGILPA
jgi:hypothetical protein